MRDDYSCPPNTMDSSTLLLRRPISAAVHYGLGDKTDFWKIGNRKSRIENFKSQKRYVNMLNGFIHASFNVSKCFIYDLPSLNNMWFIQYFML